MSGCVRACELEGERGKDDGTSKGREKKGEVVDERERARCAGSRVEGNGKHRERRTAPSACAIGLVEIRLLRCRSRSAASKYRPSASSSQLPPSRLLQLSQLPSPVSRHLYTHCALHMSHGCVTATHANLLRATSSPSASCGAPFLLTAFVVVLNKKLMWPQPRESPPRWQFAPPPPRGSGVL